MSRTFDRPAYTIDPQVEAVLARLVAQLGICDGLHRRVKALSAGEVTQHTHVVNQARQQAVERVIKHNKELGANELPGGQ